MRPEKTDTSVCPLCGGPNGCAVAAGQPAASCWCMGVVIREETLARVPEQLQGKACICAACATGRGVKGESHDSGESGEIGDSGKRGDSDSGGH